MVKCAILQSNYIPWKGVFDMINQVDVFVFLDDVQFTKQDWRTRNQIKTQNGTSWLSIPVKNAEINTKICDIEISQEQKAFNWQRKHYTSIKSYYSKAKYYKEYEWLIQKIYLEQKWTNLSEFNIYVTKLICEVLNIKTQFINSKELMTTGSKDDKLIEICQQVNANFYLSGPAAKDYIISQKFKDAGIQLAYIKYGYPEYPQLYGVFNHFVTVLDVVFNCGANAFHHINGGSFELD